MSTRAQAMCNCKFIHYCDPARPICCTNLLQVAISVSRNFRSCVYRPASRE